MQGVSLSTDADGNPSFLALDLNHLDPVLSPLIEGSIARIQQADATTERADWRILAHTALNRVYSDDEPDYSDVPAITTPNRR